MSDLGEKGYANDDLQPEIEEDCTLDGAVPASGSYQTEKKRLLDGLRRVEGQVRGVQRMVEEERYCVEVINQIAAARMALARLALIILEEHTRGCVTRALQSREETDRVIAELIATVRRLV